MLYYTPTLYTILNKLKENNDNVIAKHLLDLEGSRNFKYTFLGCDKSKDPILTYYKNDTILKVLKDIKDTEIFHRCFQTKSRNFYNEHNNRFRSKKESIRIGKFIKSLDKFDDKEIEEFVNLFKASKSIINEEVIQIVSGDDIKKWYDINRYSDIKWSMLHNSCMAKSDKKLFNIYSDNPDKCQMVIITRNNKLMARALVWKLDKPFNGCEYLMDRIYSVEDRLNYKLKEYALENKWCHRSHYENYINIGYKEYIGEKLKVTLTNYKFDFYPYMDTFKRLDRGVLHNDYVLKKYGKVLDRTNGDWSNCRPNLFNRILRIMHLK